MKTTLGLLALSVALSSPAFAQDDCPPCEACPEGPPASAIPVADDEEEKQFDEVEVLLNEILLVDESGRIVLRKEFRNSLPFPAERVEGMLGSFVELAEDGKMRIKDRDAVRPYLPMIRGFLGGGLERLRELQKLPPEERTKAMQRLFGQARGLVPGMPDQKPEPRAEPEPEPEPEPKRVEPERMRPRFQPRAERAPDRLRPLRERLRGAAPDEGGSVEERLARIEGQLRRIERMLNAHRDQTMPGPGPRADRGARRDRPNPLDMLRRLLDRGRDGGERGGGLRDLFQRRGERSREDDGGGRGLLERGRRWRRGMLKLFEIMEPEDLDYLRKGLGAMTKGGFDPQDLRDPQKLMEKMQGEMTPEETVRFMEIFSEFIGSPEGREFSQEVEGMVQRLERLVNSDNGERMGDLLERLQKGERGQGLRDQLENLIQPRRERRNTDGHADEARGRSSARKHHGAPPQGSKLY